MKESFMRSAYYKDARAGDPKMSVLWFSNFVLYEEWNFLVFSDLAFAVFSVIFVWIWIRVHVGSTVVATISMAQIVFSMPLSLFVYRVFLQITYFSPMQILAIFVILGIGADDVFVYSDAWHQSRGAYRRLAAPRRWASRAMLCGGCALSVAASRLRPPNAQEEWLPPDHMFSRVLDLTEDGFDAQRSSYPTVSLLWGLDHLSRPKFVRYEPEKHRGDVHYSAPIRLHETAAQQQVLYACDQLRTSDGGALTRPGSTVCFLEEFQAWHAATYDGATTYDLGAETFDARLSIFRETTAPTNEVNVVASWKELIGFVDGELRFVRVDAKLSVIEEGAMDKKKRRLGQFNDLVDRVERAGASSRRRPVPLAGGLGLVQDADGPGQGLLLGLSLAFPVAFAVLVLATQNVILATSDRLDR
ncbi:hypothetical protein JL720_15047 [Aureococcus anophagefferens]|nr:hypothetical protein JL720_15047 [Aureococcus anophagefferens]